MPAERFVYALADYTVEKRKKGWYFARSANRHNAGDWRGPYRSEVSVSLVIARHLRQEIVERYRHQLGADAGRPATAPSELANGHAETPRFRNYYRCDHCGHEWEDEWSCMCDDDCLSWTPKMRQLVKVWPCP